MPTITPPPIATPHQIKSVMTHQWTRWYNELWRTTSDLYDGKVGVDVDATPGYLGAAAGDGVLRVDSTLDYTDGGDFVTIGLDATLKSNYDAAFVHVSSDGKDHSDVVLNNTHRASNGSDHSFLDQSVTVGASPTHAGLTLSGLTIAGVVYIGGANNLISNANHTHDGAGTVYASVAYNTAASGEYQINANKMLAGSATITECGHTIDSGTSTILTAVGSNIGAAGLSGTRNVFVGDLIASRTVAAASGTDNILIGYKMAHSTTALQAAASYNTIVGSYGGLYITTANANTGAGYKVMETLATGTRNSCFGYQTGKGIYAAVGNCLFGYNTGSSGDTDYRTLFGYNLTISGAQNTVVGTSIGVTTGTGNTIVGGQVSVGTNPSNTAIFGYYAGNKAFDYMCAFGGNAGANYNSSKVGSCFFGYSAGNGLAGTNMVLIGRESGGLSTNRITNNVILVGAYSGFYNATADRLIIDNQKRASAAAEVTDSIIHGDMNSTVSSQQLRLNTNVTIRHALSGIPDEITATSAGVAASVLTVNTEVTTNGDSDLDYVTLANGVSGQIKHIYCVAVGNAADSFKITPANMVGGTQITFAASPIGLGCTLVYADNEGWVVVANNGGTIT